MPDVSVEIPLEGQLVRITEVRDDLGVLGGCTQVSRRHNAAAPGTTVKTLLEEHS